MAKKFLSDIELDAGLVDVNGNTGTSGQILSSTGSSVSWVNQGDVVAGEADKALSLTITVKNTESVALTKGQVVCAAPSATPPSGNVIEVKRADNNGTDSMPAIGVLNEGLDAAGGANDEGEAIMFGRVSGINTSAFSVGDEVFVSDTAGGLTTTKPTGVKYIQKVGVVIRDDATNGTIEVFGAGRTNDVPTPLYVDHAYQRLGIGTPSPTSLLHVLGSPVATSGALITARNSDATSSNTTFGGIMFNSSPGTDYSIGKSNVNSATTLSFRNANTGASYMDINSSGYVGIGTASPNAKLTVQGDDADIYLRSNDYTIARIINRGSSGTNLDTGLFSLMISDGTNNNVESVRLDAGGNSWLNGGNVGIGTDSPSSAAGFDAKLQLESANPMLVYKETDQSTKWEVGAWGGNYVVYNGTNERMRITSSGNVAIYETLQFFDDSSTPSASAFIHRPSSNTLALGTNSTERMRIDSSGNVGIKTPSPSSDLHINNSNTLPVLRLSYEPVGGYGGGGSIRFQGGASDYVYGDISWYNGSSRDADFNYAAAVRTMSFKVNERNTATNGYFKFYNGSTEVAEINAAGVYGNVFYDQGNTAYYVNPASTGNSFNSLGYAHIRGGITTDGNARSYTWRALENTGSSGTRYQKIARITSSQSSRFVIELAGRSTSYSTPYLPAIGYIVGQLNNDNDYDLVFYNHSGEDTVVDEVGQVDVSTTATDIYIKVSSFSEVTAHAHISDGTIAVESTSAGGTEPTNYVVATIIEVWNSRNDGAGSGLDADLLDGQQASYFINTSGTAQIKSGDLTVDQLITTNNGNGANVRIGDDAWIGDTNVANTLQIQGTSDSTKGYIVFGSSDNTALGRNGTGALTYGGNTIWHAGNDGSGSGLDADTLDGQHASDFASSSHTHTWANISGETANSVNGWGGLRHQTNDGYIDFGPANTSHAHIYTDRPSFYINTPLIVAGGSTINSGDIRANLFYDKNNTNYYVNPGGNSEMSTMSLDSWLYHRGDTDTFMGFAAADTIRFVTNSAERMEIGNGGVVFGGGATAAKPVHVATADQGTARLRIENTNANGDTFDLIAGVHNVTQEGFSIYQENASATRLRIDDDGNVKIGSGAPSEKLDVDGNITASDITGNIFYDKNNTAYYLNPAATSNLQELEILRNSSNYTVNLTDAHDRAGLMIKSSTAFDSKLAFSSGASSRQYIQALNNAHTTGRDIVLNPYGGNVGIGITAPVSKLHVYNNDGQTSTAAGITVEQDGGGDAIVQYLLTGTKRWTTGIDNSDGDKFKISQNTDLATDNVMTLDTSGNVGIGTTSPGAKLQINNAATVGSTSSHLSGLNPILYLDAGNAAGRSIVIKNHSTGNDTVAGALRFAVSPDGANFSHASIEAKQDGNGAVDTLEFRTSSSNTQATTNNLAMIIEGGDVGIGITSPGQKLHVNGNVAADIYYDRNNTGYFFNGDASKDNVDLTSGGNFAINVLGTISGGHRKHGNLETLEMQWSIGGSTDLNWKKLVDVVISDANYAGWGAEIEITNFSGNFGSATYNGGELFKGALSIYHWGGSGYTPEVPHSNIPYEMRSHVRWYKIQESGQNRYQLQVKSPGNYQQLYIKVKPGIGNQVADLISYANDTNGATSGGTAYTSSQSADFNHEFAGGIWTNSSRNIGWKTIYGNPYLSTYYGSIITSSSVYIGGSTGNGQDLFCDDLRSNKVFDRAATAYYFEGGNTGDSIRVAGDVVAYYSSDKRLKDNIKPIENALDKVNAISGVTFEWNEKSHKTTGRKDVGVVAQEVEEVFPEIVETRTNGFKAVDYQKLTAVLIESVKELTAKVEALESKQCNCK